jgi:hypothetical protein
MNRWLFHRLLVNECESLLNDLSTRQYLHPHEPLREALARLESDVGVCPNANEAALQWLDLDGAKALGRLRRTELTQLARAIHRFWRQTAAPQPAEHQ